MKITIATVKAGQVVSAGYKATRYNAMDDNRFVGFRFDGTYFSKLKDLKEFLGVKSLKDMEASAAARGKGSITAEFQNVSEKDPYLWGAYLWEGSFRVGTSADRLSLAPTKAREQVWGVEAYSEHGPMSRTLRFFKEEEDAQSYKRGLELDPDIGGLVLLWPEPVY